MIEQLRFQDAAKQNPIARMNLIKRKPLAGFIASHSFEYASNFMCAQSVDPLQQRIKLNNNVAEWDGFVSTLNKEVKSCDYAANEVKVVDISNTSSCIRIERLEFLWNS